MTSKSNPLAYIVLAILMQSPEKCMRRRDIRDNISKKYRNKYAKNSFDVILSRKLNHLMSQGLLKKRDRGHMQVYYYIPKRREKKIAEELERQAAHKKFDEFWDLLTPEQRKLMAKDLQMELNAAVMTVFQDTLLGFPEGIVYSREVARKTHERIKKQGHPLRIVSPRGNLCNKSQEAWFRFLKKYGLTRESFHQIDDNRQTQIEREFIEYWHKGCEEESEKTRLKKKRVQRE